MSAVVRRMLGSVAVSALVGAATVAIAGSAGAAPNFQLPFTCGQQWRLDTWGHNPALDMVREPNQTGTEGAALLAPAAGTVNQSFVHGNAGNVIQINHGGGHFTTYLHLQSRAVSAGTRVAQGRQIGRVGRTGPTSNNHPHLHYEQGLDRDGNGSAAWGYAGSERVAAVFNGTTHTGSSRTWRNVASRNCGAAAAPDRERVSDFSGDGAADVLGVTAAGNLLYYPNNNFTLSSARELGHGWESFAQVMAADFSGDGAADVLGVTADGNLLYYPNNNFTLSSPVQIGHGWGSFRHVMAADFSGDGAADVLGVTAEGTLLYYPNNNHALSAARELGHGWESFRHVMAADFSGDGAADVLGVTADGNLLYYPNNNFTLSSPVQIGHGWGSFRHVMAADFSGDGAADVSGVTAEGTLLYYPNNNHALSAARELGHGWSSFLHVM